MGIKERSDHSQRVLLMSLIFSEVVTRDVSQGSVLELILFPIFTWLVGCTVLSANLQTTPNWGGRAVKTLEGFAIQRDIQKLEEWAARNCTSKVLHLGRNNLSTGVQAATTAKRTLDCSPESAVCKSIGSDYSPLVTCLAWDTMASFRTGTSLLVQERC